MQPWRSLNVTVSIQPRPWLIVGGVGILLALGRSPQPLRAAEPSSLPVPPPSGAVATRPDPMLVAQQLPDTTAVTASADGQWVAGVHPPQAITVWAAETGDELQMLPNPGDSISTLVSATISTAGTEATPILLSGGNRGQVSVWQPITGVKLQEFTAHSAWIGAIALDPTSSLMATGSGDYTVKLWQLSDDLTTVQLQHTLSGHTSPIYALALTPDGQTLISAGWDEIRLWDVASGQLRDRVTGEFGRVSAIAIVPDRPQFISGSTDGQLRLWPLLPPTDDSSSPDLAATVSELASPLSWSAHANGISSLAIAADPLVLVSSGADNQIRIWDPTTGTEQQPALPQTGLVQSLALTGDGQTLIIGAQGHQISLWNLAAGRVPTQLTRSQLPPVPAEFLPFPYP